MQRYIIVHGPTGRAEVGVLARSERAAKTWVTRNVGYRDWTLYFVCPV